MRIPKESSVLDMLVEELEDRRKTKGASGTSTSYYMHGPGGLFSQAGVNQDVISTVVTPTGLLEVLPAFPTVYMNPLFQFVTGFRADTGSEASEECGSCKTAGIKKGCITTAVFGRYCRQTKEMNIERVAERINRSEETDLRLLNPVLGPTGAFTAGMTRGNIFESEVMQALIEVGVSMERLLARQLWIGNPANNVNTSYMEFPGLELLVTTGHIDAINGTSCPSLDSDIKDFAYQDVCEGNSPSIVETLTYMMRYLKKNASSMQLDPVDFKIVMREELFYELTSCWPCSYLSFRCFTFDGNNIDPVPQINAADGIAMRDQMRQGKYLLIDGVKVQVVLDDGIPEDTNTNNANLAAGEFSSDIYILPFSVRGNFASMYLEYFDFSKAQGDINTAGMGEYYKTSDNGKFLWMKDNVMSCFLLEAVIRPRLILLTPHLAGRLQNIKYSPLQHTRQPFPDDGYFVNGGVVERSAPSFYNEWTQREQ